MASTALAPIFTRSYKPASAPPRFSSAGGRPWEDLSLKLKAGAQHGNVEGLLPEGDQLVNLPLELLLLICEHASFGTLLALSRTTKALRRLLLTRSGSTEALWELVREKEGWPVNIDKETSIVRYAHMLEGWECQVCGRAHMSRLDEKLRVRVKTEDEIEEENPYMHALAYDCVLYLQDLLPTPTGAIKISYFEPDVLLQSAHLYRIEALAERCGRDPEDATADYVDLRLKQVVEMNAQAKLIDEQVTALADADRHDELRCRRIRAEQELEALGYKPQDYGNLLDEWWHDSSWWTPVEREERPERGGQEKEDEDEDEWDSEEEEDEEDPWGLASDDEDDEWDEEACEMSHWVEEYFVGEDDDEIEWDDVKLWVVTYVHRRSLPRVRKELEQRRAHRLDQMRPLGDQIVALLPHPLHRIVPSFDTSAMLPAVKPFWYADSAVVDPSTWSASHPAILADVLRSIRALKLRLFSRIARTLTSLPPHLALTLSSELVDADPHHAPLHHLLSDADVDAILSRPTALFRCGVCSTELVYPSIVEHLRDEHGASAAQCAALACAPDGRFCEAVRALLEAAEGLGAETTDEELRGMGVVFEVDEEVAGGHVVRTRESWDQLTSGRHLEDRAWRYEINPSHDRRIVAIRLAR
ncbi:hypothetical protein JCM8208_004653 [Rhodotorula glutinis]